jgi:hypothetical protein
MALPAHFWIWSCFCCVFVEPTCSFISLIILSFRSLIAKLSKSYNNKLFTFLCSHYIVCQLRPPLAVYIRIQIIRLMLLCHKIQIQTNISFKLQNVEFSLYLPRTCSIHLLCSKKMDYFHWKFKELVLEKINYSLKPLTLICKLSNILTRRSNFYKKHNFVISYLIEMYLKIKFKHHAMQQIISIRWVALDEKKPNLFFSSWYIFI